MKLTKQFARWFEEDEGADAGSSPHVLELRVHGVNATPPHAMLEVAADDAEKVRGDTLGSFWAPSAAALAHARSVPATHHDHIPANVNREAYSWGPMARNSPSLPGTAGKAVVAAVSRAGWMLLLPLGLANVAYWSRQLAPEGIYGRGARSVRVFGLGLSLLLVTALSTVSLDIVGTQCIQDSRAGGVVACPALPSWLTWLAGFGWSERLAILAVVPVAGLGFLHWLASGSRVRFEQPTAQPVVPPRLTDGRGRRGRPARALSDAPMLAQPGLWSRWVLARTMANLHLAGGLALVALTIAWTQVYVGHAACHDPETFFTDPYCRPGPTGAFAERPVFGALLVLALGALLVVTVAVAVARADAMPTPRVSGGQAAGAVAPAASRAATIGSRVLLVVAGATFVGTAVASWFLGAGDAEGASLLGLVTTPGALVAVLLGIALAGLGWRRAPLSVAWVLLALLAIAGLAAAAVPAIRSERGGWLGVDPLVVAAAALVALVVVSVWPFQRKPGRERPWREVAWAGAGPGVFLLLSLGTMMMLTGILVVAVGDWLNGPAPAGCLASGVDGALPAGCEVADPGSAAGAAEAAASSALVVIPATYTEFAVATVVVLAVIVLVALALAAVVAARSWWVEPDSGIPAAEAGAPTEVTSAAAAVDAAVQQPAGRLADLALRSDLTSAVSGARRLAALTHRAEFAVGVVAAAIAVAVGVTLFMAIDPSGSGWVAPSGLVPLGLWLTALLWIAAVARVVTAPSGDTGRPIALIWDLMCFLPRSAHPFGPPCYAERAVPEIAARTDAWLRGDDLPTPPERRSRDERRAVARRRVVLSAHSLGAVLVAAALFTRDSARDGRARGGGRGGSRWSPTARSFVPTSAGCSPSCSVRASWGLRDAARPHSCAPTRGTARR